MVDGKVFFGTIVGLSCVEVGVIFLNGQKKSTMILGSF